MEITKSSEKLTVSSGSVLCVDQYMLSNPQFLSTIRSELGLKDGAKRYGGAVFEFPIGEYHVYRDPQLQIVAIAPEDCSECNREEGLGAVIESFGPTAHATSTVRIDNRCLVISDAAILDNDALLAEFAELRKSDRDKQGRDLLRGHGAAVRYGFNKAGDELSLFARNEPSILAALWPE